MKLNFNTNVDLTPGEVKHIVFAIGMCTSGYVVIHNHTAVTTLLDMTVELVKVILAK